MKIKHCCGHEREWNPPEWMVRDKTFRAKFPNYIKYLESMHCIDCEMKRKEITAN